MRNALMSGVLLCTFAAAGGASAQAPANPSADRAAKAARAAAEAAERAAQAAREAADAAAEAAEAAGADPRALSADGAGQAARVPEAPAASQLLPEREQARADTRARIVEGVANGPNDRSLKAAGSPDLQLIASADEKIATLAWTVDVSGSPRPGRLSYTLLTLTASSALDSGKNASILGLKGFPGGTEIKGSVIHYSAGFKPQSGRRPQLVRAQELCRIKAASEHRTDTETRCDPFAYPGGAGSFVAAYNPGEYPGLLRDALPGNIYFFGGDLTASQADYEWLDQPAFTMRSKSRFGYGGSIFGGVILPSGQTSFAASLTYARRYKAADEVTLCQPINAVPQSLCITAAGGPPNQVKRGILSLEARHAWGASVGEFAKFAIAPEFSWDFNNDAYSVDLPVYLVGDGKGKLRGGARLGYLNTKKAGGAREDDFTLALFVGVPFSVFH